MRVNAEADLIARVKRAVAGGIDRERVLVVHLDAKLRAVPQKGPQGHPTRALAVSRGNQRNILWA